jgi:hypothetical protein
MDVISFTLTPTTSGYARYDYCGYLYIITEVGWLHAQTSCLAVVYFILYLRGIQLHVNLKERKGTSKQNTKHNESDGITTTFFAISLQV